MNDRLLHSYQSSVVPLADGTDEEDFKHADGASGDKTTTSATPAAPTPTAALLPGDPQIQPRAMNSDRLRNIEERRSTMVASQQRIARDLRAVKSDIAKMKTTVTRDIAEVKKLHLWLGDVLIFPESSSY